MLNSNELLQMVNERLVHIAEGRTPESLYEPIKYVLSIGGKRIRPILMLLAYNMYKDDPQHPTCGGDISLCTNGGTTIRPSSQATPCWYSPISRCCSATATN